MTSIFGKNLKVSIFGQSHSEAIGVVVDGFPSGFRVDLKELQEFMNRRAPGRSNLSTQRKESDEPEFLSGLLDGVTCGAPLSAIIRNKDVRSGDYSDLSKMPRPGHADFTARVKYGETEDYRGGGHFSGRLTAPLCIAGGIAIQMLREEGIHVESEILEIGGMRNPGLKSANKEDFIEGEPWYSDIISAARESGDSLGGIVECKIKGVPAGIGDPIFDGIENRISQGIFGIPAIKGIEFGAGFELAKMKGSESNDEFTGIERDEEGNIVRALTKTNNAGGILGGISNGQDIVFRVVVKPTPSIAKEQNTVIYETGEPAKIIVKGRHDPCIVPRVLPCVEAVAAIAILDYLV